jgi:hypothetical protein
MLFSTVDCGRFSDTDMKDIMLQRTDQEEKPI